MLSPVQSNCDAHDIIANGQYGAVWSMGHTQQDDMSVFCRRRTSNTISPVPSTTHILVVLNDLHSRETTLVSDARRGSSHYDGVKRKCGVVSWMWHGEEVLRKGDSSSSSVALTTWPR
ncbi:hypothetical protein TNCV_3909431 [Trichonephila clavipes]|nr:hypothetical protein TNCV_3909431 [Trichonephila clavipes]